MKRLYTISIMFAVLAGAGLLTGCAMDSGSQTEGSREGVSSTVNDIVAGEDGNRSGNGQQAGKGNAEDPRAVVEHNVAPQPQPWRGGNAQGSDDPNQPQPQPWNPNPDPSDPNNQKK